MKNALKLIGIIALAMLVIGFSFTACSSGGAGSGGEGTAAPTPAPAVPANQLSAAFESRDNNGNVYLLEITKKASGRAAYVPTTGDTYILTIISATGEIKKSRGTVAVKDTGVFQLTPVNSKTPFTVTTSGENMTAIIGPIVTDEGNVEAPGELSPADFELKIVVLKANRWDTKDSSGESWDSDEINLKELTTVEPRKGFVYRFKISGKTDTQMRFFRFQLNSRTKNWSDYIYLGNWGEQFLGAFDNFGFSITIVDDPLITDPDNPAYDKENPAYNYASLTNKLWQKFPSRDYMNYDNGVKLPADIEIGYPMATITDLKIRLVEVTQK